MLRVARIELDGPGGQRLELAATGMGELTMETVFEHRLTIIRDTGLPPHGKTPAGDVIHRFRGQFPFDWAFIVDWEEMGPAGSQQEKLA